LRINSLFPLRPISAEIFKLDKKFGKSSIWHPHLKKIQIPDKKDSEKGLF
jgi:hypothetical protein